MPHTTCYSHSNYANHIKNKLNVTYIRINSIFFGATVNLRSEMKQIIELQEEIQLKKQNQKIDVIDHYDFHINIHLASTVTECELHLER